MISKFFRFLFRIPAYIVIAFVCIAIFCLPILGTILTAAFLSQCAEDAGWKNLECMGVFIVVATIHGSVLALMYGIIHL
jgi:hypothetical protein